MTTLETHDLSFRAGPHVLVESVALSIASGELVVLVGPNGAGKSTLCGLLAGDLTPSSGAVHLDGRVLATFRPPELARRRAVLRQRQELAFPFPVREVVLMGRHPHLRRGRAPGPPDRAVADDAMRDTDIEHLAERSYTTLSGGEQTRVALARVLAQQAPALLLDEPTTALDLRHQQEVMAVCRRRADAGDAVLVVLHELSLAAAWADRVGVMHRGRLIACGPPAEVLTPEVIGTAFEQSVVVVAHPRGGWPVVIPDHPSMSTDRRTIIETKEHCHERGEDQRDRSGRRHGTGPGGAVRATSGTGGADAGL